ncbi:hypothetical protein J4050_12050 [Winogradskyella sp. DF17]|uniref:Carboxypeptidase regulatory-like domain-containing protein n=1 Tax=Winogradskyella pelagia TaxID=2819984 RepID=A0ABS3T419_9FLAO|nr:hypothetical protein [Winogradskyella sp. DF17]MBO3117486.1 hypothetical protein [Winogradskyella sp. DF17]
MKKIYIKLIIVILIYSCTSTDDDSSIECFQNCTVIEGKILSSENLNGIGNVEVIFYFKRNGLFSSNERIIARSFTDNNGDFTLEGFINDDEIEAYSEGSFIIDIVDESLTDEYFKSKETVVLEQGLFPTQFIDNKLRINEISTRDTIINYEIIIPKIEIISLNITNFEPTLETDKLEISNRIQSGIPSSNFNSQSSFSIRNDFNEENFTLDLVGGKNLSNLLIISKRKNNIQSQEIIELDLESSESLNIEY